MRGFATLAAALLLIPFTTMDPARAIAPPSSPGQKSAPYATALKAVEAEDYREAVRLLNEVVAAEPRNADALNHLGFSYRRLGRLNEAVAAYARALKADPDHLGANEYLGRAHLALGRISEAAARLAHLWNLCGPSCEAYRSLNRAIEAYKEGATPGEKRRPGRW